MTTRTLLSTPYTRTAAIGGGVAITAAAAVLVLYAVDPVQGWFYPQCPLLALTGLLCPGCGTLRSLHALLNGAVAASIGYNPLLWAAAPFGILAALRHGLARLGIAAPPPRLRAATIWTILAVLVAYSVLRNLPVAPFHLQAP
jgi:hypothetical protein